MMNNMTINAVVANVAREAGIRNNEMYAVEIVNVENNIAEMVLTTEWNSIECYADVTTGEVLGLMATAKSMDEVVREMRKAA